LIKGQLFGHLKLKSDGNRLTPIELCSRFRPRSNRIRRELWPRGRQPPGRSRKL